MYVLDICEKCLAKKMETCYYDDCYKTYKRVSFWKKAAELKKYFMVDAGQLVIGLIGLILMVVF